MITFVKTQEFSIWIKGLRDRRAASRVGIRIDRMRQGHLGDVKPAGNGIVEMRIDYGPSYRVYFIQRGVIAILLLCDGDKSSQGRDIRRAKIIAKEWEGQW